MCSAYLITKVGWEYTWQGMKLACQLLRGFTLSVGSCWAFEYVILQQNNDTLKV